MRDLFPPELAPQRAAFGRAMHWVFGEFVAQRAQAPVSFLAQLGRDHRKYGVTEQHYDSMRRAWYSTMRSHLIDSWTAAVDDAATQAINLITGIMSGAADAEDGPAWWDGTVLEHQRVSRDIAVVRLHLDRPMPYHSGQYVNVSIPQWPRRWRFLSPPCRLIRTASSSSTCVPCRVAWSAMRWWPKPGRATGGGCPVRMARWRWTATGRTC